MYVKRDIYIFYLKFYDINLMILPLSKSPVD